MVLTVTNRLFPASCRQVHKKLVQGHPPRLWASLSRHITRLFIALQGQRGNTRNLALHSDKLSYGMPYIPALCVLCATCLVAERWPSFNSKRFLVSHKQACSYGMVVPLSALPDPGLMPLNVPPDNIRALLPQGEQVARCHSSTARPVATHLCSAHHAMAMP